MNPEDPASGFRHTKVLMFINEQMAKHAKGPEFYLDNLSLSWEEVEEKLRIILEDSKMPTQVREACAWGSLALGVRFACRQGHLQGRRVQWLHDFASLHRSAAHALASDLKKLTDQQEKERKEAAYQLRLAHAKLAELQRERDLMRLKLLHAELRAPPIAEIPAMTSASAPAAAAAAAAAGGAEAEKQNAGDKEDMTAECETEKETDESTGMAAPPISTVELTDAEELEGSLLEDLGAVEWKEYFLGLDGVGEGEGKSMGTPICSVSEPVDLRSTPSPQPVTIELPESFTYSYESPFPVTPTPSPPPSVVTEPQMPPYFMATDMNMSETEGPTVFLQEPPKDRKDSGPQQQRKTAFRRAGDWDCPWCKAINFSRRETCFRCGRRIWLQSPQGV